ncbi:MAG TPA: hypothetical protein VF530_03280 [Planctomycetota bacterium]
MAERSGARTSFWLGAVVGVLTASTVMTLLGAWLERVQASTRGERVQEDTLARLENELAATRSELAQAREAARPGLAGAQRTAVRAETAQQAHPPLAERAPRPSLEDGILARVPGLGELLAQGDLVAGADALAAAFEAGTLGTLELMQLAVQYPPLLVAGVNEHALPDEFRAVLIDALSSLDDPLGTIAALDLEGEPNQGFSARIARVIARTLEQGTGSDERVAPAIERLLAGNEMGGEKVNLYPLLAQLSGQGDARARAALAGIDPGFHGPGLRSLLEPPPADASGSGGAVVYSVQYNKGAWSHRPRQLEGGDVVTAIGGERVSTAADFFRLLKGHQAPGLAEWIDADVLRPAGSSPQRYQALRLQLDPGDLQLLYGVYSVQRP